MPTENAEVARLFRELADVLELQGANPFRVRAYRNAARTVEGLPGPAAARTAAELAELPGIGADLAGKIVEAAGTGRLAALESIEARFPKGLLALLQLPGLGPKRIQALHRRLHVTTVDQLDVALRHGRVRRLPGFGPRLEGRLRQAVEARAKAPARLPLATASQYGESMLTYLRAVPGVRRAEIAGSYRRGQETVGDLDILVTGTRDCRAVDRFVRYPAVAQVLAAGPTRASIRLRSGLQVDLRMLRPESYGAGLYYFTGSKAHNIELRRMAQRAGLKINEYGVFRGDRRVAGKTEAEVAGAVGLPWIPPELREDRGEFAAARAGRLPHLVELGDLRGDLHCHTTASDGRDTLEAMARAAEALGHRYLAITDHSPAVRVARGMDAAGFRRQWRQIDRWNERGGPLTLLKGAEVDILADGTLDLDDVTLAALDIVLVSVHSRFGLPRREQTRRVLRALAHPSVDVLAHPSARLIGQRPPIELDVEAIVRAAVERGVMLEVNAQPERLDLDDTAARAAVALGATLVVSTDAHATAELGFLRWGVTQVRRGWVEVRDVANARSLVQLRRSLHARR